LSNQRRIAKPCCAAIDFLGAHDGAGRVVGHVLSPARATADTTATSEIIGEVLRCFLHGA